MRAQRDCCEEGLWEGISRLWAAYFFLGFWSLSRHTDASVRHVRPFFGPGRLLPLVLLRALMEDGEKVADERGCGDKSQRVSYFSCQKIRLQ